MKLVTSSSSLILSLSLFACVVGERSLVAQPAGAIVPVALTNTLAPNDDSSTGAVQLNIGGETGINFFGQNFTQVYVNNNGNLTFQNALSQYTPGGLANGVGQPIIAPFFADVDTNPGGSPVMYGNAVVNGFNAFVANYVNVAYYSAADKLNSFQVILIDRSDTGSGNFDIEYNYNQVLWETGSASGGRDGLGGASAAVGYSNGLTGNANVFFQLPGSLTPGSFINGGPDALISHSLNSNVLGRYVFPVRNGQVVVPLAVTNASLGSFAFGSAINVPIQISGGTPPYTVTAAGPLPAGISLANNTLSGSSSQAGNYSIPITVTDSAMASINATLTYAITGAPPGPGPVVLSGNSDLGTIPLGNPISGSFSAAGGVPPYSVTSVGTLPQGIFLTANGIAGIPAQPGNYSVSVQLMDSTGAGASVTFTYSVFGFTSTSLPAGIAGAPYSASVGVAGGTPPYGFIFSGLPHGLSGNSSGGINGVIVAPSTIPVTVTATEASGVSVSSQLTLVFSAPAPLAVPTTTLPAGTISTTYSQALSATGGAPPYTWSLSSGALPQGLSLRSGGTVTGIPAQTGTFSFGVRATDYTGASAVGSVSLTVAPAPLIVNPSSGSLSSGMVSVEYPAQTLSASGGMPPYNFAVTAGSLPAGLSLSTNGMITGTPAGAGTSSFTVTVTDSATSSATAAVSIMVRPFSTDLLLSTSSLTFSLAAGTSSPPPAQQVTVQSTAIGTPIGYSVSASSTAPWVTVAPAGGTTPGAFTVSLNNQALSLAASATPYSAAISVACLSPAPCTGNSQQVAVSLTVNTQPPTLNISSSLLSFTTTSSAPQGTSQTLSLQDTGGGSIGFSSISCSAPWCSVSSAPGSISAGGSASVTVSADPTGLGGGYYRGLITITSSVGVYSVPVTLFIAASSTMALEPAGAQFQVSPGGTPTGPPTSFLVNVTSNSAVTYTASVSPNANWLTLGSSAGTATAAQPGTVAYGFNTSVIAGLAPQVYYGTIQVSTSGVVNSPQTYEVVLNVLPAGSPQRPQPSPAGLLFITSAVATPPAQTVSVATSSLSSVAYQLSTTTTDGANWLLATPAQGTAVPGAPATTQVSVNSSILQPGVYYGGVNYAFPGAGVRTVNVTLIVTAVSTSAHDTGALISQAAAPGCTPAKLVPAQTGLLGNFSAPVAWPTPLSILLADDCGNTITNGQIVATFSNGDPPLALTLADPRSGTYAGTWTPRNSSPQVNINARASAPSLPTVTAQIAGAVTPNAAPVLFAHSTMQIFNPEVGGALAPGTLVQISGSGLAVASASAPSGAVLPTVLNGTQVIVGGTAIPLQSVTPTLLTGEVPFELTSGMQYQIIVSANGALTTPDTIQLTNTSPGVSTGAAGLLTAYHLSGTAVSETSPAAPGEVLFLLAAGLGATNTPVPDGAPSPASPLANALDMPSLTINNEPAAISFAGLQPGAVGIYQVNFTVPADAANGDLTLVLSQDGVPSNSAVLPVKKQS